MTISFADAPGAPAQPEAASGSRPAASERRPAATLGRNRGLDGLRGLAVLVVVVYHFEPDLLPGGYLGVSIFFTLSGFLITNLLVHEWRRFGRVDGRHFWSRRARRLLPASFVGIALAVLLTLLVGDGSQLRGLGADTTSALFYVANWRFVLVGESYGANFEAPSLLLHFWSLAIEEQFYLFLGTAAVLVAARARSVRPWWWLTGGLVVLSVATTVWFSAQDALDRVYFGTDTRSFELAAGMALALAVGTELPARFHRGGSATGRGWLRGVVVAAGVAALATLLVAMATIDDQSVLLVRGLFLGVALLTVTVVVNLLDDGPLSTVFSWRPLVGLGLISYGVYLYHWPLMFLIDEDHTGLDGVALFALRAAVTLALALASYHLLEQPIRRGTWPLTPARVVPLVGVTMVALIAVSGAAGGLAFDRDVAGDQDDLVAAVAPDDPTPTTPPAAPLPSLERVLFLGDSLVHQAFPTISATLAGAGIDSRAIGGPGEHLLTDDGVWLTELRDALAEYDPDVVVLEACCGSDLRRDRPDTVTDWDSTLEALAWRERAREATDIARASGAVTMWVLAPAAGTNGWYGPIEERIESLRGFYERLVACRPGTGIVDWQPMTPGGAYTTTLTDTNGSEVEVRTEDGLHFTPAGQRIIAELTRRGLEQGWAAAQHDEPQPGASTADPASCADVGGLLAPAAMSTG